MPNIYVTGDKHGDFRSVKQFCKTQNTTKDDLMIILGDSGINYYGDKRDVRNKTLLQSLPITFMIIKGNHDARPSLKTYTEKNLVLPTVSGTFLVEESYPDLLFATESFYSFRIDGKYKTGFVISGAYSVDKYYRLRRQDEGFLDYKWFADEQLSDQEMKKAEQKLLGHKLSFILSHTCPFKYEPVDMFISSIDQSTVDDHMERWLDTVEENIEYDKWYCGHWHTDRTIDKMRFTYNDFILLE